MLRDASLWAPFPFGGLTAVLTSAILVQTGVRRSGEVRTEETVDRQRIVRTTVSLVRLALDQEDRPEGENALRRASEWVVRHSVTQYDLTSDQMDMFRKVGIWPLPEGEPPRGANSRGSQEQKSRNWAPHWHPPVKVYHEGAPYQDTGTCPRCGSRFERGRNHSGNRAKYCSPWCFNDARRDEARERMRARRAKGS